MSNEALIMVAAMVYPCTKHGATIEARAKEATDIATEIVKASLEGMGALMTWEDEFRKAQRDALDAEREEHAKRSMHPTR